jgi:predicted nucleic acid-binding Zn ribbon protein
MGRDVKPLGKVLEELLHAYRLKSKVNEVNLVSAWEEIVGPLIAKKTEKLLLKGSVLHLTISSAPLKQELDYSKPQLMGLIEKRFGKGYITGIIIH